jgi:hypothetical protein
MEPERKSEMCSLLRVSTVTQAEPCGQHTGQDSSGKNDANCLQRLAFYYVSGVVDCVFGGASTLFDRSQRRSDTIVHGFSDYRLDLGDLAKDIFDSCGFLQ